MQPRMSQKELDLFLAFLRNCSNYAEFGTGGSTFVASQLVKSSIVALDSSVEWLDNVQSACEPNRIKPKLIHVDIGPIGDWGVPTDPNTKDLWPNYHEAMFQAGVAENTDLYMVDGRFRVACFAQIVLHCKKDSIIMFHDFASRGHYHCVRQIAREIATSEDLSVFLPMPDKQDIATKLLQAHRLSPA